MNHSLVIKDFLQRKKKEVGFKQGQDGSPWGEEEENIFGLTGGQLGTEM